METNGAKFDTKKICHSFVEKSKQKVRRRDETEGIDFVFLRLNWTDVRFHADVVAEASSKNAMCDFPRFFCSPETPKPPRGGRLTFL